MNLKKLLYVPALLVLLSFMWVLPGHAQIINQFCNNIPLQIPTDLEQVTSELTVPVNGIIEKIVVKLYIAHPFREDLRATLLSPTNPFGVLRELFDDVGGDGSDFGTQCQPMPNFVLDDDAAQPVSAFVTVSPPDAGPFRPTETLNIFNGFKQRGTWELRIQDQVGQIGGTLNCWCLEITSQITPIPTLSEWGLIALAAILGLVGIVVIRRKRVTA